MIKKQHKTKTLKPSSFRKCEVNVPVTPSSWPHYMVCSFQYWSRKTNRYVVRIICTGNTTVENDRTYVNLAISAGWSRPSMLVLSILKLPFRPSFTLLP